jgi:hypothetical protein
MLFQDNQAFMNTVIPWMLELTERPPLFAGPAMFTVWTFLAWPGPSREKIDISVVFA